MHSSPVSLQSSQFSCSLFCVKRKVVSFTYRILSFNVGFQQRYLLQKLVEIICGEGWHPVACKRQLYQLTVLLAWAAKLVTWKSAFSHLLPCVLLIEVKTVCQLSHSEYHSVSYNRDLPAALDNNKLCVTCQPEDCSMHCKAAVPLLFDYQLLPSFSLSSLLHLHFVLLMILSLSLSLSPPCVCVVTLFPPLKSTGEVPRQSSVGPPGVQAFISTM